MTTMKGHILIIDDEAKLRSLLARIITLEGFDVHEAGDGKAGLKKLQTQPIDVIICDVKLPDTTGIELIPALKKTQPIAEVILLTAYGNIEDGVQAIKNGAFDYITKGDDNNKIIPLLYNALSKVALTKKVQRLEKLLGSKTSFDTILGESKAIKNAVSAAQKVAVTDATVLLTGQTGTGKEVFAQAIHYGSSRANHNFIAVNCAAFSSELLENELFGHKAGAFTGATKDAVGIFEEAHNGTVFLDEIGEMPLALQAKLLRVLETGTFLKVGDSKVTQVNVRIIAATNRNLLQEVDAGNFRQDLFYRIAVFEIALPSLTERSSDIPALANFYLQFFANKTNKRLQSFTEPYINALQQHPWRGNIRELKNIIERSVIVATQSVIDVDTLPMEFLKSDGSKINNNLPTFDLASAEKLHIEKVFHYTNGNKTATAKLLNIALTTLYRKLEEHNIS
ncbi:sigma-54-dependent transcriptional regulator [Ferruginibacter yonginensis]|uniref:Sigma-54-dependent transcriptional regulator n=1 Tax=Ferruginibacter yonginensis TaxID=1310416 RepID=A0ABV8QTG0_9BACT